MLRRFQAVAWTLLAAIPVLYIAVTAVAASRNIVFWDEFDTALALILRIDAGADWRELLERFFAINNEHRMVTSRLLFALSYWLTGTVNFHVVGAIGNLFLLGACVTLIVATTGGYRRIRLGVVLAFMMFQLEHFENFLWSGASIDHFQVVMHTVAALVAIERGSRPALVAGVILGLAATFTLAHGILVWPVGAVLLWHQRRWVHLASWAGLAVLAIALFTYGFEFNPGHRVLAPTLQNAIMLLRYWLALIGAPLTLGDAGFAPIPGLIFIIGFALVLTRGAMSREPVAVFSIFFALGTLALIAVGRLEIASATEINSRYLVLGALAWAMFIFILLELQASPTRPFRMLAWLAPALLAFNVSANIRYAPLAEGYIEIRDRAATTFMTHHQDGKGQWRLHPVEGHADVLLKMAEDRGVYTLPSVSRLAEFPTARLSDRMIGWADQFVVNDRSIMIGGWAMIQGQLSRRGHVYVMLRSEKSKFIFSTVTLQRPDVAKAYQTPGWRRSGFRTVIERSSLPAEDFDVGVLVDGDNAPKYMMLRKRLLLATQAESPALTLAENP